MRILIVLFIFFFSSSCSGQNKFCFEMKREEMLEDLSYLQSYIKDYSVLFPLQEQRTGIKVDSIFEHLKEHTSKAYTNRDFLEIVRKAFLLIGDEHAFVANKQMILSGVYAGSNKLNPNVIDYADYYYSLCGDSIFIKIKSGIRSKYSDGKYYNVRPFTYKNIHIKSGEEITSINNIPINKFIQKNILNLYYPVWDDVHRQWYDEYFSFAFPLKKFKLTVGGNEIEIDNATLVDELQLEFPVQNIPKMMVINGDILYIRIPAMNSSNWYTQHLHEYYSPFIKKVILDVRGNPGGSDGVWWDILSSLVDKPLTYQFYIDFNNKNEVIAAYPKVFSHKKDKNGNINTLMSLSPAENSVHFKGKYYVLKDKKSASSSCALASVAWQKDNMVLVGEPNGNIAGSGFEPCILTLPNSHISFILLYTSDLSGGKDNPYMNKVEIPVVETIDEYLDKILHYDFYGVEYLSTKDKMIKAVIND